MISRYLVPAALALVALSATILLFFAGPGADDFCQALAVDALQHFRQSYLTHTGRWFSVGFYVPIVLERVYLFSAWQYAALLFAIWCANFATFFFLVRVLGGRSASWRTCAKGAALIGVVWWCGLPLPGQTVYWASADLEYGVGFVMAMFTLGAVALYVSASRRGPAAVALGLALAVATFLVTGIHEVVALSLAGMLTVAAIATRVLKHERRNFVACLAAIAIVGAAMSVFAPGNVVRAAGLGLSPSRAEIAYAIYLDWYGRLTAWLTDPRLLCASLWLLTSEQFARLQPRWRDPVLRWLVPLTAAAAVVGALSLPALALGGSGPGRLHNYAFSIFVVGWFAGLFLAARGFSLHAVPGVAVFREMIAALFVVALLFTGNMQGAPGWAFGRNNVVSWQRWVYGLESVATRLKQSGESVMVLRELPAAALYDVGFQRLPGRDPTNFVNRCMAEYLGLTEVRLEPRDNATDGAGARTSSPGESSATNKRMRPAAKD